MSIDKNLTMWAKPVPGTKHSRFLVEVTPDTDGNPHAWQLVASHMFGTQWFRKLTFRVTDMNDNILFTIVKSGRKMCRQWSLFQCNVVWKVYRGHKRQPGGSIIEYVAVKEWNKKDVQIYRTEKDAEEAVNVSASVQRSAEADRTEYTVTVQPAEDAALILVTSICVDYATRAELSKASKSLGGMVS